MEKITVKTIGSRISKWGEGPIWWQDKLVYVDIERHALIELAPESGAETVYEIGERIGTVVPRASGGYLCAGDSGIYSFDPATGDKQNLADPEAEKRPDNRFNDGKCDPAGRFWAGTISLVKKTGDAKLYRLDENHDLSVQIFGVTNSNGICWNAAANRMYYIDTPTREIRAYDFDSKSGRIADAGVIVDTEAAGYDSSPDGMTIDTEDKVWVAFCHGGCVVRFDPKTGEKLQQVDIPAVETTACAFGGPELDRLFVTTGIKKDADEPDAGKVFVVDGLGVQGVHTNAYKG
ncbi:gluconolaconase [Coraliomargarita sinensis]|uniref:Gluconolaconase n=1 Tax=Coraliomargarita sinensis TaxID=2174842 RepID=A0A317ZD47_9BACT|nr:SMP-30/gluconolactonase/LRE family protein [Coraliomargarita sinensis]PXA03184.1 gluconolaconase [Coraliomargarita sinensis]